MEDKLILSEEGKRLALQDREFPCPECETGEMKQVGFVQPNGVTNYECNECGHTESYP